MPSTETETRAAILAEARRWLGTPFHHRQRQIGRGVDCVNLLIAVYSAVGIAPEIDLPWYAHDQHLHRDEELLIQTLSHYADPVRLGDVGDVVVYGYGRTISHAAIIEDDETVIHAYKAAEKVCRTQRASLETRLAAEWTARNPRKAPIASYWSVFARVGVAAAERKVA